MFSRRPRQSACTAVMVCLGTFASPLLLAAPATAGQGAANPAGIMGVITDTSGAILPGVTVTATGPALQVPSVTSVTDERGAYRLSPLPIGVYSVLFELSGFQAVRREGVRLTLGFTARVDLELNVGGVAETVTVSGASPLVDTTSTATSTELTREQLEVLPTSRDGFHAFLNQAPGVRTNLDVGSSGLGDTVIFRFYGQDGAPWQMLEGVLSSASTTSGAQGSHVDFNAIEGTRVQTVGSTAEMPRRGLLVDSVVKSGGNDFHGSVVLYGSGSKLESNNIDTGLAAAGIRLPKLHKVQDFAGTLGGRIVRNKLWFFAGARYQNVTRDILDAFDPDGTPIANVKEGTYHFEKSRTRCRPRIGSPGFTTSTMTSSCAMRAGSFPENRCSTKRTRSGRRKPNGRPCAAIRWWPRCSTGSGTSTGRITGSRQGNSRPGILGHSSSPATISSRPPTPMGDAPTRAGAIRKAPSTGTSPMCSAAITNSRSVSTTCGAGGTMRI